MTANFKENKNIENDNFIREIRIQPIEHPQKKLNCSSSSKNFIRYSNLGESELSIGKQSDTSKDYRELTNEITKYVQQGTNDISNVSNSKNNSAIGVTFNDETWTNNNENFDNSENFEMRIKEMKKLNEVNQKLKLNKERQIKMISNPNKTKNLLMEQCLKNKKDKEDLNIEDFENIEEITEESVPRENLNHLSAEKQNVPKFILLNSNSEEEKKDFTQNNQNTPGFKDNSFNINKGSWINYPARKLQFSTTSYYETDKTDNDSCFPSIPNQIENYYFSKGISNPSYIPRNLYNSEQDNTNQFSTDNAKKFSFASTSINSTNQNVNPQFTPQPLFKNEGSFTNKININNNVSSYIPATFNHTQDQSKLNTYYPINNMNPMNIEYQQQYGSLMNQFTNININNTNTFNFGMNNNFNPNMNHQGFSQIEQPEKRQSKPKKSSDNINFNIELKKILDSSEVRTTLMIRNIPNKYDLNLTLDEINEQFRGKFDFFYLPLDFDNQCNLGYAFINFIEPMHIPYFYDVFEGKKWKKFKSMKECHLTFAKFQGKYELTNHLEKSCVLNKLETTKRPVILTICEPYPIVTVPERFKDYFKSKYPLILHRFIFEKTNPKYV